MEEMKYVRVKDILNWYKEGGLSLLESKIHDPYLIIDPSTWSMHIKQSLEKNLRQSLTLELDTLLFKFKTL